MDENNILMDECKITEEPSISTFAGNGTVCGFGCEIAGSRCGIGCDSPVGTHCGWFC